MIPLSCNLHRTLSCNEVWFSFSHVKSTTMKGFYEVGNEDDLFYHFFTLCFLGNCPDHQPISQTICNSTFLGVCLYSRDLINSFMLRANCSEFLITSCGWLTQAITSTALLWLTVIPLPAGCTFLLYLCWRVNCVSCMYAPALSMLHTCLPCV